MENKLKDAVWESSWVKIVIKLLIPEILAGYISVTLMKKSLI